MDFKTYSEATSRTCTKSFHGDLVSPEHMACTIAEVIRVGTILDNIKKSLFYGREIPEADVKTISSITNTEQKTPSNFHGMDPNLLHAALGILTESVEVLQAIAKGSRTGEVDRVNLVEEMGDIEWYMALMYRTLRATPEQARDINIRKLALRFPKEFKESQAIHRNVGAERKLMEKHLEISE